MNQEGKYIYCLIGCDEKKEFTIKGVTDHSGRVYTLNYMGLAAVVSDLAPQNARAYESVVEKVFKDFTLLPVRFGSVPKPANLIKRDILRARSNELRQLLRQMENKVELRLEARWKGNPVIADFIKGHHMKNERLRQAIAAKLPEKASSGGMEAKALLGEMAMKVADDLREQEAKKILPALESLAVDTRLKEISGPEMVLNAAFLVEKSRQIEFVAAINELDKRRGAEIELTHAAPLPPYSFVNLDI